MRSLRDCALVLLLACRVGDAPAAPEGQLRVLFIDKPPYSHLTDGRPDGLLVRRLRQILDIAKVPVHFEMVPAKRLIAEIQADRSPVCGIGWHQLLDQAAYASVSRPIHLDPPFRVLARREAAGRLRVAGSLAMAGQDRALTLAVIDGFSYGPGLDAFIAGFGGRVDRSLVSTHKLAAMVAAGRADFMFIDPEEFDYLRMHDRAFPGAGLQVLDFADLPPGMRRHLVCSRQVPAETLARIDDAIVRILP